MFERGMALIVIAGFIAMGITRGIDMGRRLTWLLGVREFCEWLFSGLVFALLGGAVGFLLQAVMQVQ